MSTEKHVPPDLDDSRVDRAVATLFALPTATARRLCELGRVRIDGRKASKGDRTKAGAVVVVVGADWFVAGAAAAVILHKGPELIVVDKPAGAPCHPLVPGEGNTVADALVALFPELRWAALEEREGGLLHRLDTGTSGCLAFARNRQAWTRLRQGFDDVDKTYLALVQGDCGPAVVEKALAPDPSDARRMRVDVAGRPARTEIKPLATTTTASLVQLQLHGGRRHQLRVHLAWLGHPLIGDRLYDPASGPGDVAFLLHAWRLQVPGMGPAGARLVVDAPLPPLFVGAVEAHGLRGP